MPVPSPPDPAGFRHVGTSALGPLQERVWNLKLTCTKISDHWVHISQEGLMPQIGQPPQQETAPRAERSLDELLDPVSFEARLVEARARRAAVIGRRAAVELAPSDRHPTPSWQTFERKTGRPANGAGWRILPFLKPDLISPGHALPELLHRFSSACRGAFACQAGALPSSACTAPTPEEWCLGLGSRLGSSLQLPPW